MNTECQKILPLSILSLYLSEFLRHKYMYLNIASQSQLQTRTFISTRLDLSKTFGKKRTFDHVYPSDIKSLQNEIYLEMVKI